MRSEALNRLEALIGNWEMTMSNAWFLESLDDEVSGWASFQWLDDVFVLWRWALGETPPAVTVIGHSDPRDRYYTLYHDDRGVARVFETQFDGKTWSMHRGDPDFHQRFAANIVDTDHITAAWDASEDEGETWRRDFDLHFSRLET